MYYFPDKSRKQNNFTHIIAYYMSIKYEENLLKCVGIMIL